MKEADSTNDPKLDETICYDFSDDSDGEPLFPIDSSDGEDQVDCLLLAI